MDSVRGEDDATLETFRREWRAEVSGKSKTQNTPKPTKSRPAQTNQTSDYATHNKQQTRHDQRHSQAGSAPHHTFIGTLPLHTLNGPRKPMQSRADEFASPRKAKAMISACNEDEDEEELSPSQAAKPPKPKPMSELLEEFAQFQITAVEPKTESSPRPFCLLAAIPDEILLRILNFVAFFDPAVFARLALVCKRLACMVALEDSIWRRLCNNKHFGFPAMRYEYLVDVSAAPLRIYPSISAHRTNLALAEPYSSFRDMYKLRPRLRFGGCYISTIKYSRHGATPKENGNGWMAFHLVVTYYRYLRFFRDGSVISLRTTEEPKNVIPYLHKHHLRNQSKLERPKLERGSSPQTVMVDARSGRWMLTGDPFAEKEEGEMNQIEGGILIETEAVIPKYMNKLQLSFGSAGKGARNNKLNWHGFWHYNRHTNDWAEISLRHDKPFYWSRVRSYGC